MPDLREEKVTALQDAIRRGAYYVSAFKIADAMLKEHRLPR